MGISAQDVKSLREQTGAGMMDCKKALQETEGNVDAAIDFLKKEGLAKAVKKGGRIAAEGLIFSKVSGNEAILLELNCETDFVGKNEDFLKLGALLADTVLANKPASAEEALTLSLDGKTVQDVINANIAVIGEKLSLRRFDIITAKDGGNITLYSHSGGRIAVLVEISGADVADDVAKDIAMHIAAMAPNYLDQSEVPQDVLDKEKAFQMEQLKDSGKPQEILEKIMIGKLSKFAGEMSLLQQVFVKDSGGKQKVGAYLKEANKDAKLTQFSRFAVGEGIEKKKEDFAAEVSKMAQ
ncbi:translation elongation factor Ts [bacterium K02(2017)]|nr:translation elongation factor Ts [bacterium K02(2017)]